MPPPRSIGRQAVYLDDIDPTANPPLPRISLDELRQLKQSGVRIIAPPIFPLLDVDPSGEIVPSQYARDIKGTGFDIITWSFERADLRRGAANAGFYYLFDPTSRAVKKDSDMYKRWTRSTAKWASVDFFQTGPRRSRITRAAWDWNRERAASA